MPRKKKKKAQPIYCSRCGMKIMRVVGGVVTRKCYCEAKR